MSTLSSHILQEVPTTPDSAQRYLFYLHGLIIEVAGIRPKSEEHGYYEYEQILETLAKKGFIVISEAREKGTEVQQYAEKIVTQVNTLLANDVPPANITIVGASKGGIIAAYVSSMLRRQDINYVILAGLFEKCLTDENLKLYGNVLSIHDRSDKQSMTPTLYFQRSAGCGKFEKIVLSLDIGHGLIYRPIPEWVEPLVAWINADE